MAEFVGPAAPRCRIPAPAERVARWLLLAALEHLREGRLIIHEAGRRFEFGPGGGVEATVYIRHPSAWAQVAGRGSRGMGESYMRGAWDTDDLTGFIQFCLRNVTVLDHIQQRMHELTRPLGDAIRRLRRPDPARDRRNIHAHYDLGDDFFELFLDDTMMYSCAVFEHPDASLRDASVAKLDRLCCKLELGPADRVVEIGSGWGGFAAHAASTYGCHVTTTTISDRQYDYTAKRIHDAGLADRVTVLNQDYRDLEGRFDKLVSIEMIEAVDWREYNTFFSQCDRLLDDDGLMALQAIVIADQRFEHRKSRNDFVKHYIFPGGAIPSVEAIARSVATATSLRLLDVEDIGRHYAETLRRWRDRLERRTESVARLGLDEPFRRMWVFYLAFCEAGFLERHVSDVQLVLGGPSWRPRRIGARPGWRQLAASGSSISTKQVN